MKITSLKLPSIMRWILRGLFVLLLSACAPVTPAPSTATVQVQPPEPTVTEAASTEAVSSQTLASTEPAGPTFTNPVYAEDFPGPYVLPLVVAYA